MRYSLNWIREYVPTEEPPQRLFKILTDLGLTVETSEELTDDIIFDLDLTANRPDCLSHLGVAREIAVALDTNLEHPPVAFEVSGRDIDEWTSITIESPEQCPRYAAMIFHEVTVRPSPDWLSKRLERIGIRSINNVVDLTNFVLAAMGQPLHAFDYDKLRENRIIVRKARQKELLTTLDGNEHTLDPDDLLIADASRAVALAGIMGGRDTEISDSTTTVLLESAYFDPVTIRRTSRKIGLTTEASQRFSRGQDPEIPVTALKLAAYLFGTLDCGRAAPGIIDVYPGRKDPPVIEVRKNRLSELLGLSLKDSFVESIFERLGCGVIPESASWRITPPSHRPDLVEEIDFVEEAARHYGYENIPPELPSIRLGTQRRLPELTLENRIKNYAISMGLSEVISYVFQDPGSESWHQPLAPLEPVSIKNPMSETASRLRTTLLPGLIRTVQTNRSRGRSRMDFFEVGTVYGKTQARFTEHRHLAFLLTDPSRFLNLKGMVDELYQRLTGDSPVWEPLDLPFFRAGQSTLGMLENQKTAFMGVIPDYQLCYAEMHLPSLVDSADRVVQYIPYSNYPGITIDMTLGHTLDLSYESIVKTVYEAKPKHLKTVSLKNLYQKDGEKMIKTTISLLFQSNERSLLQDEVNQERDRIAAFLTEKLNLTLG